MFDFKIIINSIITYFETLIPLLSGHSFSSITHDSYFISPSFILLPSTSFLTPSLTNDHSYVSTWKYLSPPPSPTFLILLPSFLVNSHESPIHLRILSPSSLLASLMTPFSEYSPVTFSPLPLNLALLPIPLSHIWHCSYTFIPPPISFYPQPSFPMDLQSPSSLLFPSSYFTQDYCL